MDMQQRRSGLAIQYTGALQFSPAPMTRHPILSMQAEASMRAALALCQEVYGQDSAESGSPLYALASCLRAAGRSDEAIEAFAKLYEVTLVTQVMLHLPLGCVTGTCVLVLLPCCC